MKGRNNTRFRHLFVRLDATVVLIAIVLTLAVIGSLSPQIPAHVMQDSALLLDWQSAARARYGLQTDWLLALGVFSFASSSLFVVATSLLIGMTLICSVHRWRRLWLAALDRTITCQAAQFDAAPLTQTLADLAAPRTAFDILGQELRRRGYQVRTQITLDAHYLRADRHRWMLLGTLANHLAVPLMLVGILLTSGLATQVELAIGPGNTMNLGQGTEWAVRNDGFEIHRDADGAAGAFEARVTLLRNASEVSRVILAVNKPLAVGRHTVYLSSYWGSPGSQGIVILAARDPGYLPFLMAGILMLIGMTVVLYFPHATLRAHLDPDGTLRVAGWGSRQALALERDFVAIVTLAAEVRLPGLQAGEEGAAPR